MVAEFQRMAMRTNLTRPARREVAEIAVQLSRVLDLTDPAIRTSLGVSEADLLEDDPIVAREIGEAAQFLGYEAILAPSATGQGQVLALLVGNRAATSSVEVIGTRPLAAVP